MSAGGDGLASRTALVTGATGRLGATIATELARAGAEVVAHGRDAARGAEVVDAITAAGGRARFAAADLERPEDIRRMADEVGAVDVLVNNAGFSEWGPTATFALADFDRLFAVNVRAPFSLVAALAPGMVERGRGSIVNIGSMSGSVGMALGGVYGATNAALSSLTRSWAAEFADAGVRVNAVAPGPLFSTRPEADAIFAQIVARTALGRPARLPEIAAIVRFLASDDAGYLTGTTIPADGGRTAT